LSSLLLFLLVDSVWSRGASSIDLVEKYTGNLKDWQERAQAVRLGILAGARLDPLPKKTMLQPIFAHRRDRDGYSVEDIAFQSAPGFYVFGNLYRPLNGAVRSPAILVPHGHFKSKIWFARTRPENQILCARLAQLGAVVFTYDMVGWGDSTQVSHHARNVLQLQLWDSIRSVDFIESLPYVDGERIGVTGASGGATQAIYLAAVDPRIKASMPVVMVSASYTGHERCEDGMPVHDVPGEAKTNNSEIAAVIAPRPLLVVSDGADWTKHFPTRSFPYLQRIYALFHASPAVRNVHLANEGHDYGPTKRALAYQFFSTTLGLRAAGAQPEHIQIESQEDEAVRPWVALPSSKSFPCEQAVTQLLTETSFTCAN
jgi:hypothetical protein